MKILGHSTALLFVSFYLNRSAGASRKCLYRLFFSDGKAATCAHGNRGVGRYLYPPHPLP